MNFQFESRANGRDHGSTGARVVGLDGLRCLAVLLVFGLHIAGDVLPGGWVGVDLFFALSGFLITSILLDEYLAFGSISYRDFYVRRFLRLAPALIVFVLIVAPIAFVAGMPSTLFGAIAALTYTMDIYGPVSGYGGVFAQTWSLSVEEQFYLIWPFFLPLLFRWRAIFWVAASVGSLASIVAGAVIWFTDPHAAYQSPFPHFPILVMGAMMAISLRFRVDWVRNVVQWTGVPLVAGGAILLVSFAIEQYGGWTLLGGKVFSAVPLVLLVGYVAVRREGLVVRALSWSPFLWLGKRSYAFYLWHFPIIWMMSSVVDNKTTIVVGAVLLSLATTALSWKFVEAPCLKLKRRFEKGSVDVAVDMNSARPSR